MNLGVCNSTELETTQRSINRKADKHILVYLYRCAAMRRKKCITTQSNKEGSHKLNAD